MTIDYAELKQLAERVPTDGWHVSEEHESSQYQGYFVADGWKCHVASTGVGNDDGITAEFIAAANPAAVLALIAEVEALRDKAACVDDCAHLIRKLVHCRRQLASDGALAEKALDYLKRKGLQGSPLRELEAGHE